MAGSVPWPGQASGRSGIHRAGGDHGGVGHRRWRGHGKRGGNLGERFGRERRNRGGLGIDKRDGGRWLRPSPFR